MDIKKLIAVATGEINHIYNGLCPDFQTSPDSRDDECPACKILTDAAAEHDEMERKLREAEARVAELEAERAEREKQEPVFWYRPRSDGYYEGPIHDSKIEQVRRESGAWVPLIAKPLQPARGEG